MTSSLELVAPSIRNDPQVIAACKAIDIELEAIYEEIPSILFWPFIEQQTGTMLDILGWEMHVDVWQGWEGTLTDEKKIELINQSIAWHQKKGTKWAVETLVQTIFAKCYVTEWFEYGGNPFFFKIILKEQVTDLPKILRLIDAVMNVKNVRSWIESVDIIQQPIPTSLRISIVVVITKIVRIPVSTNK
jgi:phage tail P2-like protein